jgi:hypothetical protein
MNAAFCMMAIALQAKALQLVTEDGLILSTEHTPFFVLHRERSRKMTGSIKNPHDRSI